MPNRLSEKQGRCLDLVAQGYTSKEIGKMIGISPFTVDAHVCRAMRTLGSHSRKETARCYQEYQKLLQNQQSIEERPSFSVTRHVPFLQQFAAGLVAVIAASSRLLH